MSNSATGSGTILGGLPVMANVSWGRDDWSGEYWAEVNHIYWMKRNGTPGKKIPNHLWDKAENYDYGFCYLIEQVENSLIEEPEEEEVPVQFTGPPFKLEN